MSSLRAALSNHSRGPNWIHGSDNNPILDLARKGGVRLHSWDETIHMIDVDGQPLSEEDSGLYSQLMWDDGLVSAAFKHSNEQGSKIPADQSLADFFATKSQDFFQDCTPSEASQRRKTLLNVTKMWGAYVGSGAEKQSMRYFWLEECIEGENLFVADTYQKIIEDMAATPRAKSKLMLNSRVKTITRTSPSGKPAIKLSKEDQTEHAFDEVVMTAPLGWLKRNKDVFASGLPPRIHKAIDNIGYGCLDKVYFAFPRVFWNTSSIHDTQAQTSKIDKHGTTPNVTSNAMPLHQPESPAPKPSAYASFTQWLSPQYAPDTNPEKWDLQALNMAGMSDDLAHPTLLFYIFGPCSEYVARVVRDSKTAQERDSTLVNFFMPYIKRMPGWKADDQTCIPSRVLPTAWANDELAGYGSYSNFQVGLEHGDADIEAIREGMPDQGIWFAGEHTAPFVALGTTTGAYWSGQAVAERIIEKHQDKSEQTA